MASAKVTSVEAVKEFQATLVKFHDAAENALGEVELELRRFFNWLEKDQMAHWQRQIRVWTDKVAQAKAELARKKMSGGDGRQPDLSEQKAALRKAEMCLQTAEQKIENIKRWRVQCQRAVEEYMGHSRQLADMLEGNPAPAVSFINRVIDRLEAYVTLGPPPTSSRTTSAGGADAGVSFSVGGSVSAGSTDAAPPADETKADLEGNFDVQQGESNS